MMQILWSATLSRLDVQKPIRQHLWYDTKVEEEACQLFILFDILVFNCNVGCISKY